MAKQATRELTVLVRYELKQDYAPKGLHKGDVVLIVRNDRGEDREVILRRSKAHSCNCASRKPCYHIKQMVEQENERHAVTKAAKVAQSADELPARPVVSKVVDIRERRDLLKAPLNGNRPFSIVKVS